MSANGTTLPTSKPKPKPELKHISLEFYEDLHMELHGECVSGAGCALDIQENPLMKDLLAHYEVRLESGGSKVTAKLANNRVVTSKFVERWNRRYCKALTCAVSTFVGKSFRILSTSTSRM